MNANWFLDQYRTIHACNGNEEKSFRILLQTVLPMAEQFDFLIRPMRDLVDHEDCPFYLNESTTYKISCCDQINDKTWLAGAYPKATFLTHTTNNVAAIEDQKNNDADMQNFFLQLESNYGDYFAGLRHFQCNLNGILNLNAGEYLELLAYLDVNSNPQEYNRKC